MLGKPAGNRALLSYNSGRGKADDSKRGAFTLQSFKDERDLMSKKARRIVDNLDERSDTDSKKSTQQPVIIQVVRSRHAESEARIVNMNRRIEVLQKIIDKGVNVEKYEATLIQCYIDLEQYLAVEVEGQVESPKDLAYCFETPES